MILADAQIVTLAYSKVLFETMEAEHNCIVSLISWKEKQFSIMGSNTRLDEVVKNNNLGDLVLYKSY